MGPGEKQSLKDKIMEKTKHIEKIGHQILGVESKNRSLFDKYSKNEKKLMKVLKKVKEENQTLLRNLKKLLGKTTINSKSLINNPAYHKFLVKLAELRKENPTDPIFVQGSGPAKVKPKKKKKESKLTTHENEFLVKHTHKLENPRVWISAIYYGSNLKRKKRNKSERGNKTPKKH